jgi:hypothetical protein
MLGDVYLRQVIQDLAKLNEHIATKQSLVVDIQRFSIS